MVHRNLWILTVLWKLLQVNVHQQLSFAMNGTKNTFTAWLVHFISFASCRCSSTSCQLLLFSKEKNPSSSVSVQVTCTIFGFTPLLKCSLKYQSCCSYLWFLSWSSTLQLVSKTSCLNSSSSTLYWHLWFRRQLRWATFYPVFLTQRQRL